MQNDRSPVHAELERVGASFGKAGPKDYISVQLGLDEVKLLGPPREHPRRSWLGPEWQLLERCYFISIGSGVGGFYVAGEYALDDAGKPRCLVVLNEDWNDEDFESAVAHELAHIWLKHPSNDLATDVERHENEAAAHVHDWGFTGSGAAPLNERP